MLQIAVFVLLYQFANEVIMKKKSAAQLLHNTLFNEYLS
jgi:hypothetical protein